MSAWPVLACVAGIILTYVFRAVFARWYFRRRTMQGPILPPALPSSPHSFRHAVANEVIEAHRVPLKPWRTGHGQFHSG